MGLHTRICDLFGIEFPIMNSPMARAAGGELAAAVSGAGGLGMIGAMGGDAHWLRAQIGLVRERSSKPFGVGFISHWLPDAGELFEVALDERVPILAHSFVDPAPYMAAARRFGAKVICQVQTVELAQRAALAGVDAIVAQGTEAGGHTGRIPLTALLPDVVRAVASIPVIAAGGIADGRAVAAALKLGADGVWIGTAFLASPECTYSTNQKRRILEMGADDTVLTETFDIAFGTRWPAGIAGRAARNAFSDRWHGSENELRTRQPEFEAAMKDAIDRDHIDARPVWAGEGVGSVTASRPAAEILRGIAYDAERLLTAPA